LLPKPIRNATVRTITLKSEPLEVLRKFVKGLAKTTIELPGQVVLAGKSQGEAVLVTIYIKGRKLTLGTLEDRVFKKKVKESKHLFRKLDAWAVDYNAFHNTIKPNADRMEVYDTENRIFYDISCADFEKHSEVRRYNRNGENLAQMFCSRRHWVINGGKNEKTITNQCEEKGLASVFGIRETERLPEVHEESRTGNVHNVQTTLFV
jgi:hypothetical protein